MEDINNGSFSNNQGIPVVLGLPDLRNLAGWATFKAVIDIIVGALSCLGFILIVPAVYGVIQILAGVKLLNAADEMKRYMDTNDTQKVANAFISLNKHFKLTGISIIVKICAGILLVILYSVLIAMLAPYIEDILNSGYYGY